MVVKIITCTFCAKTSSFWDKCTTVVRFCSFCFCKENTAFVTIRSISEGASKYFSPEKKNGLRKISSKNCLRVPNVQPFMNDTNNTIFRNGSNKGMTTSDRLIVVVSSDFSLSPIKWIHQGLGWKERDAEFPNGSRGDRKTSSKRS